MKKLLSLVIFALTIFSMLSCGVKDESPTGTNVFGVPALNSCVLDTAALGKILEKDITKEINCLEDNLDQFVKFVNRENSQYIGREELRKFINKFFPDAAAFANDILRLVFDLNSLLLKDPEDKVSVKKLKHLFQLFKIVNQEGRVLNDVFKNIDDKTYWDHRKQVYNSIQELSGKVVSVIGQFNGDRHIINITEFLSELKEILEIGEQDLDIKIIESYLFVKRLLLGGNKEVISPTQMEDLLYKVSDLSLLALDVLHLDTKKFHTDSEEWFFYFDVAREFTSFFHPFNQNSIIFTHKDLVNVAERFFGNEYRLELMEDSIKNIKKRFFGGDEINYTFKDVTTLTSWATDLTGQMYFNHVTFDHYDTLMKSPAQITSIAKPDLEEYNILPNHKIKEFWTNYETVTLNFRYFGDNGGNNHYFTEYHRFRAGFSRTSMFRWLMTKVIRVYGKYVEGNNEKQVGTEEVAKFMRDIEGIGRELGIWPRDFNRFINEAVNGSDLFQFNANGNGLSDVNELSDYVTTIISATKQADLVHKRLQIYCPLVGEDGNSFEIECYREYFLHIFFNELGLQSYFDQLSEYVRFNGWEEAQLYMRNLEAYSREIPDESLPMTKVDLTRLVIAFSNVESAFLRFDKNRDSVLHGDELSAAFDVFEVIVRAADPALKTMDRKIVKSTFLYLIKNMEVPSQVQLILFHLFGKKKKITSTRFNISAILSFFAEAAQNSK